MKTPIEVEILTKLFEMWLEKKHPYLQPIFHLLILLHFLAFGTTIIFVWFFAWWWKYMLCVIISFFITRFIYQWRLNYLLDVWKNK